MCSSDLAAANVIYMAGMKFGATGNESLTWAMNAWLPGIVCERYSRSRIVAFSTGCVYPYVNVHHGGATEATHETFAQLDELLTTLA